MRRTPHGCCGRAGLPLPSLHPWDGVMTQPFPAQGFSRESWIQSSKCSGSLQMLASHLVSPCVCLVFLDGLEGPQKPGLGVNTGDCESLARGQAGPPCHVLRWGSSLMKRLGPGLPGCVCPEHWVALISGSSPVGGGQHLPGRARVCNGLSQSPARRGCLWLAE